MRAGVQAILEGLSVSKAKINEAKKENRPVTREQFMKYAEQQAKKYKAESAPWAAEMRDTFAKTVYSSAMSSLKPQGFDDIASKISSNLRSFFANEVQIEAACPSKWQKDLVDYVKDFKKKEKEWIASRFKFTEERGQTYVQKMW